MSKQPAPYLGYLGVTTLWAKNNTLVAPAENIMSNKEIFLQGLITNVLNPKVALFFISFMPQFIDPQNIYGIVSFLTVGDYFLYDRYTLVFDPGALFFDDNSFSASEQ